MKGIKTIPEETVGIVLASLDRGIPPIFLCKKYDVSIAYMEELKITRKLPELNGGSVSKSGIKHEKRAKYTEDNKDQITATSRSYAERNREKINVRSELYREKNRETINARVRAKYSSFNAKARTLVSKAIKEGVLIRPAVCPRCEVERFVEGHHEDYNKPLDVMWLCRSCHRRHHADLNKKASIKRL